MSSLFPNGIKGLSDSKFAGAPGSVYRSVGLDLNSTPGLVKVAQKLTKNSSTTVDELCKNAIRCSDGSTLWFSSESGKIWRESSGTYTLVYTTDTTDISIGQPTTLVDLAHKSADVEINLTDDTGVSNDCRRVAQRLERFSSDTEIKTISVFLKEVSTLNGSYDLKCSIYSESNGSPNASVWSVTQAVGTGDIGTSFAKYTFTFTDARTVLQSNTTYWVVLEVDDYTDVDATEAVAVSMTANGEYAEVCKIYDGSSWITTLDTGGPTTGLNMRVLVQQSYREEAFDLLTDNSTNTANLTDDTSITNDCTKVAQSFTLSVDSTFDTAYILAAETVVNGGYSLKVSLQHDSGGSPDGSDISSSTKVIGTGDIGSSNTWVKFTFASPVQMYKNTTYWFVVEVTDYADIDPTEYVQIHFTDATSSGAPKIYKSAAWTTTLEAGTTTNNYELIFGLFRETVPTDDYGSAATLGVAEFQEYVYWSTQNLLNRIHVDDIGSATSWTTNATVGYGEFANGDDTYHPMLAHNLVLYIGDGQVMASVTQAHVFTDETSLNVLDDERIQTLVEFDVDILIGTVRNGIARILRWDGISDSWFAEDTLDENGINAFIRDDNFVYAQAGDYGRIYFYNGEKMEPFKRIPGEWGSSATGKIFPSAVATLLGVPVFGLSNTSGNPALQGVYSLGSYSRDYPKVLDLTYPISSGDFTGVSIGAIVVYGADMWVAWKVGSTCGVDKIDYTAKYASAYVETTALSSPEDRSRFKTVARVYADYHSLPANTGITFSYKKIHETNYTALTSLNDAKLMQVRSTSGIPEVANLQLKLAFTVSSNNAPEVENIGVDLVAATKAI